MLLTLALMALLAAPLMAEGTTNEATKPADVAKDPPADTTKKAEPGTPANPNLINWGNEKKTEAEDPNSKQPATKVDLATVLNDQQKARIDAIAKEAAKGDDLVAKGAKAYAGEERMKKADAIKLYHNAGQIFFKASNDIDALAKAMTDENTKLTILRTHGDGFKAKAVEAYCKAAVVIIEEAKTLPELKKAEVELKMARVVDKNSPALAATVEAYNKAVTDITTKMEEAAKQQASGGSKKQEDEDKPYDDGRATIDPAKTGRTDTKRTGR
jgi:hypothetical protein